MMVRWGVTPNAISLGSVGFAVVAAAALVGAATVDSVVAAAALFVVAAAAIQGRLVCNLIDGLVAVEGGRGTPSGELFNDVPDRLADPIILVAAGFAAAALLDWRPPRSDLDPIVCYHTVWYATPSFVRSLGWAAGLASVLTAYVRVLGVSIGTPADFGGPMAKQHRMAVMTAVCVVAAGAVGIDRNWAGGTLYVALWVVLVGCVLTIALRLRRAHRTLEVGDG